MIFISQKKCLGLLIFLFSIFIFNIQGQNSGKMFVVVIDPGHGGKDNGAKGAISKEKNINLKVALLLGDYIKAEHSDVKVVYTRTTDKFIALDQRSRIANKAKADLFISIHTNSNKARSPYGAETYTLGLARTDENLEVAKRENSVITLEDDYKQKYEGFDPNSSESYIIFEFMQNKHMAQSVTLASSIQKEFSKRSGRKDRGVRQAGFLVLRASSMPSVLVELGFISNRNEEKYLNSDSGQKSLAKSISAAFTQYKKEHDRKSGQLATPRSSYNKNVVLEDNVKIANPQLMDSDKIYKIQLLASDKRLSSRSAELKGYKADFYVENGMYKYTYGESSDWDEICELWRSVQKKI